MKTEETISAAGHESVKVTRQEGERMTVKVDQHAHFDKDMTRVTIDVTPARASAPNPDPYKSAFRAFNESVFPSSLFRIPINYSPLFGMYTEGPRLTVGTMRDACVAAVTKANKPADNRTPEQRAEDAEKKVVQLQEALARSERLRKVAEGDVQHLMHPDYVRVHHKHRESLEAKAKDLKELKPKHEALLAAHQALKAFVNPATFYGLPISEILRWKEASDSASQTIMELEKLVSAKAKTIGELTQQLTAKDREVYTSNAKFAEIHNNSQFWIAKAVRLGKEAESLASQVRVLQNGVRVRHAKIDDLTKALEMSKKQTRAFEDHLIGLSKDNEQIRAKAAESDQLATVQKNQIKLLGAMLEKMDRLRTKLRGDLAILDTHPFGSASHPFHAIQIYESEYLRLSKKAELLNDLKSNWNQI